MTEKSNCRELFRELGLGGNPVSKYSERPSRVARGK